MKRRIVPVLAMNFDTRATLLSQEIGHDWAADIKELHRQNYTNLVASLSVELGPVDFYRKLEDFKTIGSLPFSIISYHVEYMRQTRGTFVQGHYYPALTGACALGERILNHLVLDLRDEFADRKSYTKVAAGKSFDSWQKMLYVLDDWGVLLPDASTAFRRLEALRNRSLHFNVKTYANLRDDAIAALQLIDTIVQAQFSAGGLQPWFLRGTAGASFLRKDAEQIPFVRKYYVPLCPLVGIRYAYSGSSGHWRLFDFRDYDDTDVSDEDFTVMLNKRNPASLAPTDFPPSPKIACYELSADGVQEWRPQ